MAEYIRMLSSHRILNKISRMNDIDVTKFELALRFGRKGCNEIKI